jgi:hypothetical protein
VNQVNGHHRIRRLQRPRKLRHIKVNGAIDVSSLFLPNSQGNRLAKLHIWIGRLPSEAWERFGEMHNVLSRAAGDL